MTFVEYLLIINSFLLWVAVIHLWKTQTIFLKFAQKIVVFTETVKRFAYEATNQIETILDNVKNLEKPTENH